jgi:IS30 family transposase
MNKKLDWKKLDPKVAELCASLENLTIEAMAQRLGASVQTVQRSMRRQGINRYRKAVSSG